jgi:hypothetical protein
MDKKWGLLVHLGGELTKKMLAETVFDMDMWNEYVDHCEKCGVNFIVLEVGGSVQWESHPEIVVPGAWSKEFVKSEILRLREKGIEVVPHINFSTTHSMWLGNIYSRMVSTPTYYKVVDDLITEVSELFDTPDYFHIGMDEEFPHTIGYQKAYGITHMRQGELYWHDMDFYLKCCNKNKTRGWTWCDMGWFMRDGLKSRLSREYIVSNAMYERLLNFDTFFKHPGLDTYYFLSEQGFEQIPTCATYQYSLNPEDCVSLLKDVKGVKGFITAPWFRTREIDKLKLMAEAKCFGHAIKGL